MSFNISQKRITKDIKLLNENKDILAERGIFFFIDEANIMTMKILIIAKHKQDISEPTLVSPYVGGMFLFIFDFTQDYPMSPPNVTFNPKQSFCRLHPNYYENGKVCLSVLNTWSTPDWCATMSILSLITVCEERLNEQSICFEPSHENECINNKIKFNDCVQFAVHHIAISNVLENKYKEYSVFKDVITPVFKNNGTPIILR